MPGSSASVEPHLGWPVCWTMHGTLALQLGLLRGQPPWELEISS
jgi:hypothetical protein